MLQVSKSGPREAGVCQVRTRSPSPVGSSPPGSPAIRLDRSGDREPLRGGFDGSGSLLLEEGVGRDEHAEGADTGKSGECSPCCVRAVEPTGDDKLEYVGQGQGKYISQTCYRYVGPGKGGDFASTRRSYTGIVSILFCVCLMVCTASFSVFFGDGPTSSIQFDCDIGFLDWEILWSQEKREFCCSTQTRGCATTEAASALPTSVPQSGRPSGAAPMPPAIPSRPTTSVDPFNCAIAWSHWDQLWPDQKKDWCCQVHGKGCPTTAAPAPRQPRPARPAVPAGAAPVLPWETNLPPGIVLPTPGPNAKFDCAAGFANWVAGWAIDKKMWCCAKQGKGCMAGQTKGPL